MEKPYLSALLTATVVTWVVVSGCNGNHSAIPAPPIRHEPLRPPQATGGPGSNLVWVLNNEYTSSSLTGFQVTDNGDLSATQIITGDATQLVNPFGLFKTKGTLFVTEDSFNLNSFTTRIVMFPVSSNGNVAPTATIAGSNTGLYNPFGIVVTSTGDIIVADYVGVLTFAPGKFGNVSPLRVISGSNTQLNSDETWGIATHNGLIYVVSATPYPQLTPEILVFHVKDNGNVAPFRVITGPHTGLKGPRGVKVDKAGDLYVTNADGWPNWNSWVTEYAPNANGDAAPIATLQGASTLLSAPMDLILDNQSSRMYIVNWYSAALTGYALPITANEAPFMDIQGGNTKIYSPYSVGY